MGFVEEYLRGLVSEGLLQPGDLVGCTDAEIGKVTEAQRVERLPTPYRDLLRAAGHGAGDLMRGSDWLFEMALTLRDDADDLLMENDLRPDIVSGAVVFFMHQGYLFYYFPADHLDDADPPVWLYHEGDVDTPRHIGENFSGFLNQMRNELVMLREIQKEWLAEGRDINGNQLE